MTILRNTRRITELTVQRKLFHSPPIYCGFINKDKQLLKKEEFGDIAIKRESSDVKWFRNAKNRKSHQYIPDNGLPNIDDIIEHNDVQKVAMKRDKANKKRYSDAKKNICYQRIPAAKDLANGYDMVPHNHVIAPNKVLSNELKANRNQIIYHRVFNVPDVNRQKSFFRPSITVKWFAKRKDEKGGTIRKTGGQFDKPSSANEDGFLHKHDKELRWRELKKKLGKEHEPDAMKKT